MVRCYILIDLHAVPLNAGGDKNCGSKPQHALEHGGHPGKTGKPETLRVHALGLTGVVP